MSSEPEDKDAKTEALLRLLEWGPAHGFPRSLEEAERMDAEERRRSNQ